MTGRSTRRSTRLARRSRRRFPICQGEGWLLAQLGARPSIGNQFILRSSSGLSQPPLCTALPHPLHCTALLFLVLHNALHSTKDVLHCVASNSTLCAALLDSLAQQCSADKPEETVAAQQCQLSILQFLPLCIFQSSVFSAVFTKSIFRSWSVTKKSPLPAEILYHCHLFCLKTRLEEKKVKVAFKVKMIHCF